MKTRWMHLIAGFTMCILCISICATTTDATVIWSDDFSNPDLPGWTIFGYENDTSPVKIEGNFSAASGMLKVLDDDMNIARHNSTRNVGTWSFDMFVPDETPDDGFFYVDFMSNGAYWGEFGNLSVLCVGAAFGASYDKLYFLMGLGSTWLDIRSYTPDVLQGWHHIDVSRTSDGHFYVWFNGTLEDDFVNNDVTNSTYLEFFCDNATDAAIDNLVVSDTNYTPSPPTTPPPASVPWELIAIGGGVAAVVIVLVIVFLRRR